MSMISQVVTLKSRLLAGATRDRVDFLPEIDGVTNIWDNVRFKSDKFRYAHVELFRDNEIMVLHMTIYPSVYSKCGVFGVDVIYYIKQKRFGAVFCDVSPTVLLNEMKSFRCKNNRDLPLWADKFSDTMLSVVPEDEYEFDCIADEIMIRLDAYLDSLSDASNTVNPLDPVVSHIVDRQNSYSVMQRKNKHTMKALRKYLGGANAKVFMNEVLFPLYDYKI